MVDHKKKEEVSNVFKFGSIYKCESPSTFYFIEMNKKYIGLSMYKGASPSVFRKAKVLRNNMTPPEKILWNFLRQSPMGYKFRRQHPYGPYILDFYCHQKKLSIEIDGEYHDEPEHIQADKIRTTFILENGLHEVRFKNLEILENLNVIKEKIVTILRSDALPTDGQGTGPG